MSQEEIVETFTYETVVQELFRFMWLFGTIQTNEEGGEPEVGTDRPYLDQLITIIRGCQTHPSVRYNTLIIDMNDISTFIAHNYLYALDGMASRETTIRMGNILSVSLPERVAYESFQDNVREYLIRETNMAAVDGGTERVRFLNDLTAREERENEAIPQYLINRFEDHIGIFRVAMVNHVPHEQALSIKNMPTEGYMKYRCYKANISAIAPTKIRKVKYWIQCTSCSELVIIEGDRFKLPSFVRCSNPQCGEVYNSGRGQKSYHHMRQVDNYSPIILPTQLIVLTDSFENISSKTNIIEKREGYITGENVSTGARGRDTLMVGKNVLVYGVYREKPEKSEENIVEGFLDIYHIDPIDRSPFDELTDETSLNNARLALDRLRQTQGSPYDLLVDSFAPHLGGNNIRRLKEAAILSIVSMGDFPPASQRYERNMLNIFFIGEAGTGKTKILEEVQFMFPRHSLYATGERATKAGLLGTTVQLDKAKVNEAGAFALADKGVLLIDEMNVLDKDARDSLNTALEKNVVPLTLAGSGGASFPCRTAVITAQNPTTDNKRFAETMAKSIEGYGAPLLSRFDVFVKIANAETEAIGDAIENKLLQRLDTNVNLISANILKAIVVLANSIKHTQLPITIESASLIKNWYVAIKTHIETPLDSFSEQPDSEVTTPRIADSVGRIARQITKIDNAGRTDETQFQVGIEAVKKAITIVEQGLIDREVLKEHTQIDENFDIHDATTYTENLELVYRILHNLPYAVGGKVSLDAMIQSSEHRYRKTQIHYNNSQAGILNWWRNDFSPAILESGRELFDENELREAAQERGFTENHINGLLTHLLESGNIFQPSSGSGYRIVR